MKPLRSLAASALLLVSCASCSGDSEPLGCYQNTPGGPVPVPCPPVLDPPDEATPHALCVTPGGESVTPVASCAWSTPPTIVPTSLVYGSASALQACDVYAAPSPIGADARVMVVSSGMTGGTRSAAAWVRWALHTAASGVDAYVCDVRHSASGGVYPFPAPNSDARCIARAVAALSPTGHLRGFGASAGATLLDHSDATADRTALTFGGVTVTLDDGTCATGWGTGDAAIFTRVSLWSEASDIRVKAKVSPFTPQANLDAYLNLPLGESDPAWVTWATLASPVNWHRSTEAPRLVMASNGDTVMYRAQSVGSAYGGTTCATDPTGIIGTKAAVRAAGVNCTSILNACPVTIHLPAFLAPLTSGECTADIF